MEEDLLASLHETRSQLFPAGTTCFPAVARPPRSFWLLIIAVFIAFPLTLGFATFASGSAATVLLMLTLLIVVGGLGAAYWLRKRHMERHSASVRDGSCLEGVFVFPDGQLCVRFQHTLSQVNEVIAPQLLGKADVEIRFSFAACARVSYLRLHCMDPARGRQRLLRVSSTLLADDVIYVAASINEAKMRFLSIDAGVGSVGVVPGRGGTHGSAFTATASRSSQGLGGSSGSGGYVAPDVA